MKPDSDLGDAQVSLEEQIAAYLFDNHRLGSDEDSAATAARETLLTTVNTLTTEEFRALKEVLASA